MAKLFPRINPDSIENRGERQLARVLIECLPANIEVFHSFNWLAATDSGRLIQGESDFVILDPDFGLLVVEVKGGEVDFDSETQLWYQNGAELRRSPFEQVRDGCGELKGLFNYSAGSGPADKIASFGYAVSFPDHQWRGTYPPASTPRNLWDAGTLDRETFLDTYRKCLAEWNANQTPLTGRALDTLRDILRPQYQLVESVVSRIEDGNRILLRLTENQKMLLDSFVENRRVSVKGDAGSGKTMVALEKARRLASEGHRTLFVCYNRMLADWIKRSVPASEQERLVALGPSHRVFFGGWECRSAGA